MSVASPPSTRNKKGSLKGSFLSSLSCKNKTGHNVRVCQSVHAIHSRRLCFSRTRPNSTKPRFPCCCTRHTKNLLSPPVSFSTHFGHGARFCPLATVCLALATSLSRPLATLTAKRASRAELCAQGLTAGLRPNYTPVPKPARNFKLFQGSFNLASASM